MSNTPQPTKIQMNLEEIMIQQMTLPEILTFKVLQNYHKLILINFLSIFFLFLSSPVLKSSGIIGIIFTSLILAYIHFRFGNIIFAIFLSLVLSITLFYLSGLI